MTSIKKILATCISLLIVAVVLTIVLMFNKWWVNLEIQINEFISTMRNFIKKDGLSRFDNEENISQGAKAILQLG